MFAAYQAKKLVLVLTTCSLMTMASIKTVLVTPDTNEFAMVPISKLSNFLNNNSALTLECILSIYYLVPFKKD